MRCGYPRCKDCPVKITIEGAGQIKVSSESLLKCCRVKEQLKWAKKKNEQRE